MANTQNGPLLLWLDLTHDGGTEALMAPFRVFSECRLVQSHSVVDSAKTRRIDMICMHFDRPDALGLNQLLKIKRAAPSIPISMFTVQHSEELAVWAMRSGVWEYVTLPLSETELCRYRQALQRLLELRQQAQRGATKVLSEHFPALPPSIRLTTEHQKHQSLGHALQYIDLHFRESLDQKELARLCGMTPSRFSRLFKDVHGVCYLEYILEKRLEFAKERLDNTQMPITTIGYEAGFRDPSYFARAFKQFVGCTPSEYRQRTASEEEPALLELSL
ncbi:helix-turn-helix domain-containing protein [Stutzerimonas stutzeri]|uniref:helix-turn-helix domain-containing protein n=1 Tax=Stutzerimonas stutzeri TaxID=316 RepID=UPI001C2E476B|nr:AraC family transcriptional regulator [Stutzerimonas stutzeri]